MANIDIVHELGFEIIANAPADHTAAQLARLVDEWTQIIQKAGIKVE